MKQYVLEFGSRILMIWAYSKLNINNWYLKYDHEKNRWYQKNMFFPRQNIVFDFTENTDLNRMQCYILFLLSREN